MQEYIDREAKEWSEIQDAIALEDGAPELVFAHRDHEAAISISFFKANHFTTILQQNFKTCIY